MVEKVTVRWIDIEREFLAKRDLKELYLLLRQRTIDLNVCNSSECAIFPELSKLNDLLMKFEGYGMWTKEDAIKEFHNTQYKLKEFNKLYDSFRIKAQKVLDKLFALFSTNCNRKEQEELWHRRKLEVLDKINYSPEIEDDMGHYLEKAGEKSGEVINSAEVQKAKQKLKKQMLEMKKKWENKN